LINQTQYLERTQLILEIITTDETLKIMYECLNYCKFIEALYLNIEVFKAFQNIKKPDF